MKKTMILLALAVLFSCASGVAQTAKDEELYLTHWRPITVVSPHHPLGHFMTGNKLLEACQSSEESNKLACLMYIMGVVDVLGGSSFIFEDGGADVEAMETMVITPCLPHNKTEIQQYRDIVVNFLVAHPTIRQKTATWIIYSSLMQAYPCSTAKPN
jgi:hypothetical protein